MPKNTIQADALLILWAKATALCLTLLTIACLSLGWALFGWTIQLDLTGP